MSQIRTVCVYCGSSPGTDPEFIASARRFGELLAKEKIGLVYGGGSRGLMGEVANAVLENGGHVIGVIPEFLKTKEGIKTAAQEIIITADMHTRKQTMFMRADAFVALPGGIGTLEELVEQMTWAQLGQHPKPILIANIAGFWDPLLALVDHMAKLGFVHSPERAHYLMTDSIEAIIPMLRAFQPPGSVKAEEAQTISRM
jgi:uncharacterized protein (TIGR00730 family)